MLLPDRGRRGTVLPINRRTALTYFASGAAKREISMQRGDSKALL
jgi:hypothetical protein